MRAWSVAALTFALAAFVQPPVSLHAQADNAVEEIFVTRNVRVSRNAATNFCAAAGFKAQAEDVYEYHAAEINASGRYTSTRPQVLGQLRACIGSIDAATAVLWGKGVLNGVPFTTRGTCPFRSNFPTAGFITAHCGEELTDLPPSYVGGQLVTNALSSSMPVGPESTPSGYVQSGVTIFRLWRQTRGPR
jgi:hypothetical protein